MMRAARGNTKEGNEAKSLTAKLIVSSTSLKLRNGTSVERLIRVVIKHGLKFSDAGQLELLKVSIFCSWALVCKICSHAERGGGVGVRLGESIKSKSVGSFRLSISILLSGQKIGENYSVCSSRWESGDEEGCDLSVLFSIQSMYASTTGDDLVLRGL
ncbi:hypothetical protein TNCV_4543441 [Trichonephila clavipes]|nr:hypothetical protein TNCV_4543441 [Trichonephila clavipes]